MKKSYNGAYSGEQLSRVAFPMGGIGAGMVCLEGSGALSHVSLRNKPDVFNEPMTFSALCVKGKENTARVLEGPVPAWKIFGAPGTLAVDAPSPQHLTGLPSLTRQGGVNSAQPSDVAPDVILPAIYIPSAKNMGPEADAGFGMTRRRYCELPVPAVDSQRIPQVAMTVTPIAGRKAMAWPRAFQRFPNRGSDS